MSTPQTDTNTSNTSPNSPKTTTAQQQTEEAKLNDQSQQLEADDMDSEDERIYDKWCTEQVDQMIQSQQIKFTTKQRHERIIETLESLNDVEKRKIIKAHYKAQLDHVNASIQQMNTSMPNLSPVIKTNHNMTSLTYLILKLFLCHFFYFLFNCVYLSYDYLLPTQH